MSHTLVFIADRVSDRSFPCFRRVYPNPAASFWGHLRSYLNPRLAVSWLAVQWLQCEQQGRWHVVNFRPMSHMRFCHGNENLPNFNRKFAITLLIEEICPQFLHKT